MVRTPVFLLTGFLGAGKSTLLNKLLCDPDFADTAVVINEFGDIAVDHDLVQIGSRGVAITTTGCLCCTMGNDIASTLIELRELKLGGEASFSRVIVETTGLADPAPLINQLAALEAPGNNPAARSGDWSFALSGVVTLVDIVTGELSIENHFEATKQIAFADRIVLTKTDLARDPASRRDIQTLRAQLAGVNPAASILDSHAPGFDPADLFQPRRYLPAALGEDVADWLALEAAIRAESESNACAGSDAPAPFARHGGRIRTFAIVRDQPVEPGAFRQFLALLVSAAGPRLLRVKGLVQEQGAPDRPRVVHAVQHVISPPATLDTWPSDDRRTRLVFITDDLDPVPVRDLFEASLDQRPLDTKRVLMGLLSRLARLFRPHASGFNTAATSSIGLDHYSK